MPAGSCGCQSELTDCDTQFQYSRDAKRRKTAQSRRCVRSINSADHLQGNSATRLSRTSSSATSQKNRHKRHRHSVQFPRPKPTDDVIHV